MVKTIHHVQMDCMVQDEGQKKKKKRGRAVKSFLGVLGVLIGKETVYSW